MRCVQGLSVTTEKEQGLRRLTLRACSRVHQVCHAIVGFHVLRVDVTPDLGFTLSLVSDVSPFSRKVLYVNFISPRTRNSKYKVLFFWML